MTNIKELLGQISAYARLQVAMVAKIETLEDRVYKLEETLKLKTTTINSLQTELHSLRIARETGAYKII